MSPAELRDSATPPGDLRPEDRVTPQIAIPLGKKPVAPLKLQTRPARGKPAAMGSINDASARCEAEADAQARAACRDKLAHTTPPSR